MKLNSLNITYQNVKQRNNPHFGKTYLGNSTVNIKNNKSADVSFVEYDINDARDYKQIKSLKPLWGTEFGYTDRIVKKFAQLREYGPGDANKYHFYALEDDYGNTLAIASVMDDDINSSKTEESCTKICFVQTDPDEMYNSRRRRYFGLGETLISNIVQKSKDEYADSIELKSANEGFWAENGLFKEVSTKSSAFPIRRLENADFDKYIDYVDSKKSRINYSV